MTDERNEPDVEDDDLAEADDLATLMAEQEAADDDDDTDELAAAAAAATETKPDDATLETEAEPATPETAPEAQPAATEQERVFRQAEVERMIGERLNRDRKSATVRQLEAIAGQPLETLVDQYRELQVQQAQQQYAMTTEEAAAYVANQEELHNLRAEQESLKAQQQTMAQTMTYQQEKTKHLSNPLVRKYEADIDAFSASGTALPFDAAMAYIIGQKVLAGEVLENVRQGAQAKALAQVQKRAQVAPEGTAGGAAQNSSLTPQQKMLARNLGLTTQEYAEEAARIKRRQRRG